MILEVRAVHPFFKNGYVVGCEETRDAVVIDPGDEVDQLLEAVKTHGLQVRYILLTHAHLDHITGVGRAKAALGVPVGLHQADNFLYEGVVQQGRAFGFEVEAQPAVDFFYEPDASHDIRAIQGSTCAIRPDTVPAASAWPSAREGSSRDGAIRRRHAVRGLDRPDRSARRRHADAAAIDPGRAVHYPDDSVVYSGHGEPTTIGRERRTNPFLRS